MKEANWIDLELLLGRHVTVHIRQPGNAFAIGLEPMAPQWLTAAGTDAGRSESDPESSLAARKGNRRAAAKCAA